MSGLNSDSLAVISTKPIDIEKGLIRSHFPTTGDFKAEIGIDFYLNDRSYVNSIYPEQQGKKFNSEQLDCVPQDSGFFCKSEVAAHIFKMATRHLICISAVLNILLLGQMLFSWILRAKYFTSFVLEVTTKFLIKCWHEYELNIKFYLFNPSAVL